MNKEQQKLIESIQYMESRGLCTKKMKAKLSVPIPKEKKPKEESKFIKWLSPYIDTLESVFFGLMAIAILWVTIYIILLWG